MTSLVGPLTIGTRQYAEALLDILETRRSFPVDSEVYKTLTLLARRLASELEERLENEYDSKV